MTNCFREIAAYCELFKNLHIIAEHLIENHRKSTNNELYSEEDANRKSIQKLMNSVNLQSFYGRVSQFHVKFLLLLIKCPEE